LARWYKAIFFGALAMGACVVGAAWSSSRIMESRHRDLERDTRIVAEQASGKMWSVLERNRVALQQMVNFYQNSERVTEEEFHSFARGTERLTPLLYRISSVDPTWHIRWVHPRKGNERFMGFDVRSHRREFETLLRAREGRVAVLSPPLQLIRGGSGFILAVPYYRNGQFLGEVVGSFRSADFLKESIFPGAMERYDMRVINAGIPLFASARFEDSDAHLPSIVTDFTLGGVTWQVNLRPTSETALRRLHSGQPAFWTLVGLLALFAGGLTGAGTYWASAIAVRLSSQGAALQATRARLDDAMKQLFQAEKMTALGELVAGVAHEINNPLSSIMGYSQLLLARDLPAEVKRRLEIIYSESGRMGRIVKNLLAFARKQPPEKNYLGLNGIIEKTLELKAYQFRVSQIEVEKDLSPDLPLTMLDFQQMQQVILNLLNNAEQAMTEGGRGGTIRLSTRKEGNRIRLSVADDGPGIPSEIQTRIFEPFFTTKPEGKGTGLGLSLCYGILQGHGGSIRVEGQNGTGASFVVELPILRREGAKSDSAASTAQGAPGSLKILVVDAELNMQSFLVDLLASKGHRVETASDVPEAVMKIAARGHDLIISDMKMPRGSAQDIYAAVAERSPDLARRIVFTAGGGASRETESFIREKGNRILPKPFTLEEIDRAISSAVKN